MATWGRRYASASSGVDTVARALAQIDTAEAGESIPAGESRWAVGRTWLNNTAAAITVPTTVNSANMLTAGFTDSTESTSGKAYDKVLTAADTTLASGDSGALGLSDSNDVVIRIPTGLPVGTERNIARLGANNVDIYVGTGAVEIIDGSPDGAIRINEDGNVKIKKISATAWRTVNAAVVGALATTATNGFFFAPSSAGAPTGTPTSYGGHVPMQFDTTNSRLYAYIGGAWKSVTLA